MTTMADIAKRVGVSVSTVSYALSGKRPVSEETRRRVLAEMKNANFQPNAAGRALASKRSRTIALLYPSEKHGLSSMPLEFVISAAETAGRHGYALVVSTTSAEDEQILSMIPHGAVDGLILMEVSVDDPRVELLRNRNYAFTMIGHCMDNTGLSFVDLDFPHAVEEAVNHLYVLNHHHFALIDRVTEQSSLGYGPSVRSRQGFRESIDRRKLDGVHYACDATAQDGFRVTRELLTEQPSTTALIVTNTEAIGGIYNALHKLNMSIPADISIVAVTSPRIAELMVPPLTSVDFPAATMGRMGVDFLIRQLEGDKTTTEETCLLQPTITVRQSTGRAPDR